MSSVPNWGMEGEFYSLTRTEEEVSIVCVKNIIPNNIQCEKRLENGFIAKD